MQLENILPFRSGNILSAAPAPQLPILLNKITGFDVKSDIVGRAVISRRILVVDDNTDGVASLSMLLIKRPFASRGLEGITTHSPAVWVK